MKALIILLVALLLIPGVHNKYEVDSALREPRADGDAAEPQTQIANPWLDMSREELTLASGVDFGVPQGAENVVYRWLEAGSLAEMQFTLNGDEYCARITDADLKYGEVMDISGMYLHWDSEEQISVSYCPGTLSRAQTGTDEYVELCLWYDLAPGLMYSLSVSTAEPDGLDLVAVAEEVFVPMQGES